MISSKLIRSSVIASVAVCLSFACERRDQQDGGAADDTTTTPATGTSERQGSPPIDTTSTRDTMQGITGTERSPGTGEDTDTEAIERTGGQDLPMMGTGGTQSSVLGQGGYGGHAGKGGAGGAGGHGY